MRESINKGRRNELAQLKKKKRVRYWLNGIDILNTKQGKIYNPKTTDVPGNYWHVLKTTGKPCSCAMCSPGKVGPKAKYNQKLQKERL